MSESAQRHVLVIDDDELSREVLMLMLGREGYAVTTAGSGEEALALEARPAVVLMDWQLPGLSGEALARKLRALYGPATKLIGMSGSRQPLAREACDAFLLKPFSMEALDEALVGSPKPRQAPELRSPLSENEVLDPATFRGFEATMPPASLRELYGLSLADADTQATAIGKAWEAGDDDAVRKAAHVIKGSLGMVGALELQRLCGSLEEGGISDANIATLAEFPAAVERLRRILIARRVELSMEQ